MHYLPLNNKKKKKNVRLAVSVKAGYGGGGGGRYYVRLGDRLYFQTFSDRWKQKLDVSRVAG